MSQMVSTNRINNAEYNIIYQELMETHLKHLTVMAEMKRFQKLPSEIKIIRHKIAIVFNPQRLQLMAEIKRIGNIRYFEYSDNLLNIKEMIVLANLLVTSTGDVWNEISYIGWSLDNETTGIKSLFIVVPRGFRVQNDNVNIYGWESADWILSEDITKLGILKSIDFTGDGRISLPTNLSLPRLESISFSNECEFIGISCEFMNVVSTESIHLPLVRSVTFQNCIMNQSPITELLQQLPSLGDLTLSNDDGDYERKELMDEEERRSCCDVLELLRLSGKLLIDRNKLSRIEISCFKMTKNDFVELFSNILPRFPNLCTLCLADNCIDSMIGIPYQIESRSIAINKHSLCTISLEQNLIASKVVNKDKNEKKAVLDLLRKYDRVSFTGLHDDTEIFYAECINYAGRVLVEKNKTNNDGYKIPLSVWPIVLKRAMKTTTKDKSLSSYNGAFYLLQQGPILNHIAENNRIDSDQVVDKKRENCVANQKQKKKKLKI